MRHHLRFGECIPWNPILANVRTTRTKRLWQHKTWISSTNCEGRNSFIIPFDARVVTDKKIGRSNVATGLISSALITGHSVVHPLDRTLFNSSTSLARTSKFRSALDIEIDWIWQSWLQIAVESLSPEALITWRMTRCPFLFGFALKFAKMFKVCCPNSVNIGSEGVRLQLFLCSGHRSRIF